MLKACPFCGGTAEITTLYDADNFGGQTAECRRCKASSAVLFPLKTPVIQNLVELWNSRVTLENVATNSVYWMNKEDKKHHTRPNVSEGVEKMFPIMSGDGLGGGFKIPWKVIEPFDKQCVRNHDQTLEQIAKRGGLGVLEAIAVLTARKVKEVQPEEVSVEKLLELVSKRLSLLSSAPVSPSLRDEVVKLKNEYIAGLLKARVEKWSDEIIEHQRGCVETCIAILALIDSRPAPDVLGEVERGK